MSFPLTIDFGTTGNLSPSPAPGALNALGLKDVAGSVWGVSAGQLTPGADGNFATDWLITEATLSDQLVMFYLPADPGTGTFKLAVLRSNVNGGTGYVVFGGGNSFQVKAVVAGSVVSTDNFSAIGFSPTPGTGYWYAFSVSGTAPTALKVTIFAGNSGTVPVWGTTSPLASCTFNDTTNNLSGGYCGVAPFGAASGAKISIQTADLTLAIAPDVTLNSASTTGINVAATATGGVAPITYTATVYTDSSTSTVAQTIGPQSSGTFAITLPDDDLHTVRIRATDSAAATADSYGWFARAQATLGIVIIGDSIAHGTGTASPDATPAYNSGSPTGLISAGPGLAVPTGPGPGSRLACYLANRAGPRNVGVLNFGVPSSNTTDWSPATSGSTVGGSSQANPFTGGTTNNLYTGLKLTVNAYAGFSPTDFLIQLGTNDGVAATASANLAALVAQIRTDYPSARVELVRPPHAQLVGKDPIYAAIGAASDAAADGVHVYSLGTGSRGFWKTGADGFGQLYTDGLHPNNAGTDAMAAGWADELVNRVLFPSGAGGQPAILISSSCRRAD